MKTRNKRQKKKAISLIVLVITIIIMLILASVTISMTIDGGILEYARKAQESTEIANEKEAIKISAILAMQTDNSGDLKSDNLENSLKNQITNKQFEVTESGDKIYIEFKENGRMYEVDSNGNAEIFKPYIDKTPGELAQDENGYYMIESIEDLVVFSAKTNGGYKDENINISANNFSEKTVILMTNLDFKNVWSYEDSQTTIYNGYLGIEDEQVPLIEGLTDIEKYKGFIPIGNGSSVLGFFVGTFDGNNFRIDNLSENLNVNAGLFGVVGR